MWNLYSRAGQGIAVTTTKSKLMKIEEPDGFELEKFEVEYIDFNSKYNVDYNRYELLPFTVKRNEFEYENEFRLMLYQYNSSQVIPNAEFIDNGFTSHETVKNLLISKLSDLPPEGIKIKINASELIDEIIASPDMKEYEVIEIQRLLDMINRERGTDFIIKCSKLYDNLKY
jgi:hypothetical protein